MGVVGCVTEEKEVELAGVTPSQRFQLYGSPPQDLREDPRTQVGVQTDDPPQVFL